VIERAKSFVPAADEVWRLQHGNDTDCEFFQRATGGGKVGDQRSHQGIWIMTPSGSLLASINSINADRVLRTLDEGLAAWRVVAQDGDVEASSCERPGHRWEYLYPEGGLVLERIARDLDPASPLGVRRPSWNRDYVWFTAEEVRAFMPRDPEPGDRWDLPEAASRLARFHLVDNVRGQTLPYAGPEILSAELWLEVRARRGSEVEVELFGSTAAAAEGPWLLGDNLWKPTRELARGIETELLGEATFDLATGGFTRFELVGLGRRWGRSEFNGRWREVGAKPIGFHFTLARPDARVAPTFIALYGAQWVTLPDSPELSPPRSAAR